GGPGRIGAGRPPRSRISATAHPLLGALRCARPRLCHLLVDSTSAECRTSRRSHEAESIGVPEIRVDGGDDDPRFDCHEVDADERDPDPGIDDDALVENAVEDVDEARSAWRSFDRHIYLP